jgi:RecA-family ATPase
VSSPVDIAEARAARARPFIVKSLSEYQEKAVPRRDWLIPSILLRRSITLFSGDGGVGKSLAVMQLQVAAALGVDWLGIPIAEPISSFGFYCEDDEDELHRRFDQICRFYGATFADLEDRVRFASRVGEPDNELVEFRGRQEFSKPTKTATYGQIMDEVENWGTQLVILDTATDIFAGNENIRYQVKAFVNLIRAYALVNNGGVILNSHPSKSGMSDGSGFSGSTAWNGAVRNRLYLTAPKPKDDEDGRTDDRMLKVMKSNYGPFGEKMRLRWQEGVFIRTDGPSVSGSIVDRLDAKAKLLAAARYLIERGANLSPDAQVRTSLVVLARTLPSCRDISWGVLRNAQDVLLAEKSLVIVEMGPPSKRRKYVRPDNMVYAGEAVG